jgi:hypothetical protein
VQIVARYSCELLKFAVARAFKKVLLDEPPVFFVQVTQGKIYVSPEQEWPEGEARRPIAWDCAPTTATLIPAPPAREATDIGDRIVDLVQMLRARQTSNKGRLDRIFCVLPREVAPLQIGIYPFLELIIFEKFG